MTFDEFSTAVHSAELTPVDRGNGHWQILGGEFVVNYYPFAKKGPKKYVQGTVGSTPAPTLKCVIRAARHGCEGSKRVKRRKGGGYYCRVKKRLISENPHCHICGKFLTVETATIDHLIPLAKGGSNGQDNLRLACEKCNSNKGNKMPKTTRKTHRDRAA